MGAVQGIVARHDIMTNDGFQAAMTEMKAVPPGELHFILAYDTGGQSRNWKQQHALAKAELERRAAADQERQQMKFSLMTAGFGLVGVVIGACLQAGLNLLVALSIPPPDIIPISATGRGSSLTGPKQALMSIYGQGGHDAHREVPPGRTGRRRLVQGDLA